MAAPSDPAFSLRLARPGDLAALGEIDQDASVLFDDAGVTLELPDDHPFLVAQGDRWLASLHAGSAWLALDDLDDPVGFATCALVDGAPYLDELAVRLEAMRRGLGRRLLDQAIAWAAPRPLWLTTYGHLPWNRPFYERAGFAVVAEQDAGPGLRALLAGQREVLPAPHERVVMRRG